MQEISQDAEIRRGLKFEAFLEPQLTFTNKDTNTSRGFQLNDAALYVSKDFGNGLSAMIDLPFGQPDGTAIAFGSGRQQAFFLLNRNNWLVHFGEFDTFFGIELNDSRDRFFADAGGLKTWFLPVTHQGVAVGYGIDKVLLRGIVANPPATNNMANNNPAFGFQARYEHSEEFYGSFGLLLHDNKAAATDKNDMTVDLMAGTRQGQFKLDGEIVHRKFAGFSKSSLGFGVIGVYAADENLGLGGRFEYAKDPVIPGAVQAESAYSLSFGPNYRLMQDVTVRGDLTLGSVKIPNVSDESVFGLTFSVVANL